MEPGATALLTGLGRRPELNGSMVTLVRWQDQRWAVRTKAGGNLSVKPENLQLVEAYCSFSQEELFAKAQASLPNVALVDCTAQLDLSDPVRFLSGVVHNALGANGATLFYVQRTAVNAAAFDHALATLRQAEKSAIPPAGWLAFLRDDYMFSSASHPLEMACRLLVSFASGEVDCCICLEPVRDSPSTGLSCGHQLHTACLHQAVTQSPPSLCCPICRAPFGIGPDGTIMDAGDVALAQPPHLEVVLTEQLPLTEASVAAEGELPRVAAGEGGVQPVQVPPRCCCAVS